MGKRGEGVELRGGFGGKRERKRGKLTGNNILFHSQQGADTLLFHMAIILLEVIRETKRHDRQPGIIIRARLPLVPILNIPRTLIYMLTLFTMDIADADIPPCLLQRFTQQPRIAQAVLHDAAIAFETEVDKVVVLGDDLGSRAGEGERVGFLGAAEVVQFKLKVRGEVGFVTPDDPADAGIDKTEFMARGVDGFNARELEIPAITFHRQHVVPRKRRRVRDN